MRLTATSTDAGKRIDVFLAEPLGSRARAQRLIDAGAVTVAGQVISKRYKLAEGDFVEVVEPSEGPAPADVGARVAVPVLYEDEHLLVVDKPAGIVVHPAPGHASGTLSQLLAETAGGGEEWRAGIVHRLDRDTSGLLVVAKTEAAHRRLKELLQSRAITREYLALVEGRPQSRTGTIDAAIGRDRRIRTRISVDTDVPREARTHFAIEEALRRSTLLRITLETGRTHQIRAHLKAIGLPVCGDPEYGVAEAYGLSRQFLHAARLRFDHPLADALIDVESPLPADLETALAQARGV